jgi:ribosome-binding protein aMBF1 (putative translation factor)
MESNNTQNLNKTQNQSNNTQNQGWQTVSYKKTEKKEPVKNFDPIIARQKEQNSKEQADKLAKNQIKYSETKFEHQQWEPTIISNSNKPKPKTNQTQREPSAIKLNESGDIVKVKKVSPQMARGIVDARIAKKWTQIQLAHNSAIDVKSIGEIERGGCIYDANVFNKLCNTLGVKIERNILIEEKK